MSFVDHRTGITEKNNFSMECVWDNWEISQKSELFFLIIL